MKTAVKKTPAKKVPRAAVARASRALTAVDCAKKRANVLIAIDPTGLAALGKARAFAEHTARRPSPPTNAVRVVQSAVLNLNTKQREQLRLCVDYCAMYMVPHRNKRDQARNENALAFLKLLLREVLQ